MQRNSRAELNRGITVSRLQRAELNRDRRPQGQYVYWTGPPEEPPEEPSEEPETVDSSVVLSDEFMSLVTPAEGGKSIAAVSFRFPCAGWSIAFILEALGIAPGALGVLTNPDLWSDRGASLKRWLRGATTSVNWATFGGGTLAPRVEDPMDPVAWLNFFAAVFGLDLSFASTAVSTALDYTPGHFVVRLEPGIIAGCTNASFRIPKGALHTAREFVRGTAEFPIALL